ncbi:major facilitator superfamily domain-containing protein [Dichotomocladium elegans]|nr:major facilitator superfamily domain-containing protein [Dichotomocladium elegans]
MSSSTTATTTPVNEKNASGLENKIDLTPEKTTQDPSRLGRLRVFFLYIGLFLSLFTISIQATVIAPAMTRIATDLNDVANQTWIATGYLIAVISLQPLAGKLSDIFGRKPIFLTGLSIFSIGSLSCALTPTMNGLIAGRTVQGFGASCIMPMIFVITTDITALEKRPRINSMLSAMFGLGSVVGPLLGGAFVDYVTWRWDFWLFLILGSSSTIIVGALLTESNVALNREESMLAKLKRVDLLGSLLVIGTICCLLLGLNWGNIVGYGWKSAHAIAPFVVAGVTLIMLGIVETRVAKEPILPPSLLGNWRILVLYLYICCIGLGFVGTLFYGPITYQAIFGANSMESGIRLIPYMGGLIVGAAFGGAMVARFPYPKIFLLAGSSLSVLGYGLFQLVNMNSNWDHHARAYSHTYVLAAGLGFGLSQQNTILSVQSLASKGDIAIATALVSFFMLMAPAIGLAVYQALFGAFVKAQFKGLPSEALAVALQYHVDKNYLFIGKLPEQYVLVIKTAYMQALKHIFIPPIVAAGLALIFATVMPNVRWGSSPTPKENGAKSDV